MNLLANSPWWLRYALGLQEPGVPNHLDTDVITPVVDIVQGGWGSVEWKRAALVTHPASTAAATVSVLPHAVNTQIVIAALEINHAGGAGAGRVRLHMSPESSTSNVQCGVYEIPVDRSADLSSFLQGPGPLKIPPGSGFSITYPTTIAAENFTGELLYALFPAGVRV